MIFSTSSAHVGPFVDDISHARLSTDRMYFRPVDGSVTLTNWVILRELKF